MDKGSARKGLLAEVLVVDLADEKASFCSKILADFGAKVIKVESSLGDSSRRIGPFWQGSPQPERSLFFWYNNTNKLGITLDLEQSADREVFLRQIEDCDIAVETFVPGYLDDLGLGFKSLIELNPGLIMVSVTGFGQTGPRKGFKSCDLVASAMGGQIYVSGSPSLHPIKAYGEQSYSTASLYAAAGVLLGLRRRAKTGKGVHIDISLQEAVASTLDYVMVRYFHERVVPKRRGDRHWNDFFCLLPCKDGFLHITPLLGWETIVDLLVNEGMADDLKDEEWKDEEYRILNVEHIIEVLQGWTRGHAVDELFELGQLMRFPWAPVHSPQKILRSPQLKARGFFGDFEHPELGLRVPYPGVPYKFSFEQAKPCTRAPLIGEHNHQVCQGAEWLRKQTHNKGPMQAKHIEDSSDGEKILNGIRILDFSRVLAGPYATRILADFGAEVIKVQSKKTATGAEDNMGPYFSPWNRNKRSITLDMSHPEAREIALKLVSLSDVIVENFSPRVMSNWGLNYEKLREVREDLIMLRMSGMGQTGPWKDFTAFGPTVQSLGGLTYLTSYNKESPVGLGYSHADVISGIYGSIAVLAALEDRDQTGRGQQIDLSEYEAVCSLIGPALLAAATNSNQILPRGNRASHIPGGPYGCYKCLGEDRWCAIAVFDESEWQALCKASGHADWAKDDRFSTLSMRKDHAEELDILIEAWTSKARAEDVMELLQSVGVPVGVVQNAEDLAKDPQLQARAFFVELEHPSLRKTVADRSPIRIEGISVRDWKSAPLMGSENRYVYLELLGLTEAELDAYIKKGVIG
jgi:crotonobetainyl-CoA:carnitine CoA-transferase CaiB-like acyl-CoA transferase